MNKKRKPATRNFASEVSATVKRIDALRTQLDKEAEIIEELHHATMSASNEMQTAVDALRCVLEELRKAP